MKYISVCAFANKWNVPERTIRNYCATGRIKGAFLTGKTWNIPINALLPMKRLRSDSKISPLLHQLREEKAMQLRGGIYQRTQMELTYHSNRLKENQLTYDQVKNIFETKTIDTRRKRIQVDDIIETANHFRCVDFIIDKAKSKLTESFIKEIHFLLKSGTFKSRKKRPGIGEYKLFPNAVGGDETCPPKEVPAQMKALLANYHSLNTKTFEDLINFHYEFEKIHPFQDGNGRVGRLILFKECLAHNIVPFIIEEDSKIFYYKALQDWPITKEYLFDVCRTAQDKYVAILHYFTIAFR